jgi:hypothetical protein
MKNIAMKLVKVMGDCNYVQKQGLNKFQNYKYASAANILEKVNESLVKNNVACFVTPKLISFIDVVTNTGKAEHLATVEVSILLVDADSGESITVTGLGSGQDNGDKGVMKAQTAAIKYAWMMSLNISTGDDPEADSGVDERMNDQKQASKANVSTVTTKPNTPQPAKPQTQPTKITAGQVKSLIAKCTKEGITTDDLAGLIDWKYKTKSVDALRIPDFAQLMNSLQIVWKEYIVSKNKAS